MTLFIKCIVHIVIPLIISYTFLIHRIWPPGHLLDLEDALKEIAYFRGVSYVLVSTCFLKPNPDPLCPTSNYSYYAKLVRSDCTKILKNCTYNNEEFPCCEHFRPIETDMGPCFILNSIQTK